MLSTLRPKRDRGRGFSLVEVLVVTVITGVIGSIVVASIIGAVRASDVAENRIQALSDLQRGLERVSRELRAADPLILESGADFRDGVGAQVIRGNERIVYRYYLVPAGDDENSAELREDVDRFTLDGSAIESRRGLFIADIANLETGTPFITYYSRDPDTQELVEIDCDSLSADLCREQHLTATQIGITLEKVLPNQPPIGTETIVNIRNTSLEAG